MNRIFMLLTLVLITNSTLFAQTNKKVAVMITRANWCPACRANDFKINNELIPAYANTKDVTIVVNDITNKKAKAKAKPLLEAAGLYDISKKEQATGSIAIINMANGNVINRVFVVYDIDRIKKAITDALAGI